MPRRRVMAPSRESLNQLAIKVARWDGPGTDSQPWFDPVKGISRPAGMMFRD